MNKLIVNLILWVLAGALSHNLWAGDFRQANWGMTEVQVKATENKSDLAKSGNPRELRYWGKLLDWEVWTSYYFSDGKLVASSYSFLKNKNTGKEPTNSDYRQLRLLLVKVRNLLRPIRHHRFKIIEDSMGNPQYLHFLTL